MFVIINRIIVYLPILCIFYCQPPKGKLSASIEDLIEEKEFNPFEDADIHSAKPHLTQSLKEHGLTCNLLWLVENENHVDCSSMLINKY
jgi:hypothetical protein